MRGKGGGGQLLRLFPYIDAKKTIPDSISHSSQQRDGYSNVQYFPGPALLMKQASLISPHHLEPLNKF